MSDKKLNKNNEQNDKRTEREKRAEITLLEILIERYPDSARRFVRKIQTKSEVLRVF